MMGTMSHDALIITGGEVVRAKVVAIAKKMPTNQPQDQDWAQLVSPVLKSIINGYEWFFVAPDGSKEWWDTSNAGDDFRSRIISELGRSVIQVRWGELGNRLSVDGSVMESQHYV